MYWTKSKMKRNQMDFEIIPKGKFIVQLADINKFMIKDNFLIVLEERKKETMLSIYEIKKQLTSREKELLYKDLNSGLKKIEEKLRTNGPMATTNGNLFYDDMMMVRQENNKAYLIVF